MGVKSVTLYDPAPTQWDDLSAQFYLTPDDIGQPRAAHCVDKLSALNQYVKVSVHPSPVLSDADVSKFTVVVAADQAMAESLRLDAVSRAAGHCFVLAEGRGLFGRVFCDFGASFTCDDVTGEPPSRVMVASISSDEAGLVTLLEDTGRHGLTSGDYVSFSEVQGMTQLNGAGPFKVLSTPSPFSFTIGDTRQYGPGPYVRGGWVTQVKVPVQMAFKSLSQSIGPVGSPTGPSHEEVVPWDFGKAEHMPALHAAWQALHQWMEKEGGGKAPAPVAGASQQPIDAATTSVLTAVQSVLGAESPLSQPASGLIATFVRTSGGHLSPMAAAIGG